MRIPVLQARVTQKLFLLWQIDIGFYDDLPGVPQQLVKGRISGPLDAFIQLTTFCSLAYCNG